MKKLFLCIGAAKTGTTWLYDVIRDNPGLYFSPEKELNYFFSLHGRFDRLTERHRTGKLKQAEGWAAGPDRDRSDLAERMEWYRRFAAGPVSEDWYRGLFDAAPEGSWICDFSPSTSMISETGWEMVAGFAEQVKLVYILREPRERLWSHAKFHAQFINQSEMLRKASLRKIDRFIRRYHLADDGDYGSHLSRLLSRIPRESLLLVAYDRIRTEPQAVLRDIEAHLGLPLTPTPEAKLMRRINVSEKATAPERFGAYWRPRFHREMALAADLGADFARPWADAAPPRRLDGVRRLVRRIHR